MRVQVQLEGCDDSTWFEMDVTDAEREFLGRVAATACETSEYGCRRRSVGSVLRRPLDRH